MAEAEARTTAFAWLGKCVFMSQGGEEADDTHRKFETTDMREWYYKCPKCQKYIPYKWEHVEWDDDCKDENGEYDFAKINQNTALKCPECGEYFEDTDRMRRILNKDGKFIPLNPNAAKENVGFHWNALASMPWGKLAELYLRAKIALARETVLCFNSFTKNVSPCLGKNLPKTTALKSPLAATTRATFGTRKEASIPKAKLYPSHSPRENVSRHCG